MQARQIYRYVMDIAPFLGGRELFRNWLYMYDSLDIMASLSVAGNYLDFSLQN